MEEIQQGFRMNVKVRRVQKRTDTEKKKAKIQTSENVNFIVFNSNGD